MPRGYWRILIALVGWLGLTQAQQGHAQGQQNEASANVSRAALPPLRPAIQPVKPVQTPKLERPCEEGSDDRNSDLCAQWKAADAARDAADWTFWGVITGIVGTIGLFWTLFYTRAAVRAAQEATKDADRALLIAERNAEAMAEQAETMRQSLKREMMPYLYATHAGIRTNAVSIDAVLSVSRATIVVGFKNFGRSPARNLKIDSWVAYDDDTAPMTDLDLERQTTCWIGDIAPGFESLHEISVEIAANRHDALASGKASIFVGAYFTFDGIMEGDEELVTHCLFTASGETYRTGRMQRGQDGNVMLATERGKENKG